MAYSFPKPYAVIKALNEREIDDRQLSEAMSDKQLVLHSTR
jgi:hypothetical protein